MRKVLLVAFGLMVLGTGYSVFAADCEVESNATDAVDRSERPDESSGRQADSAREDAQRTTLPR